MPRRRLTEKQKKLLTLLSVNLGNEKPKTLYQMLIESGYSEETARQQNGALAGIRDKVEPIVQSMVDHREKVMKRLTTQLPKAKYRDLVDSLDKLTKNIQLLNGGKTSNESMTITWE